MVEKLILLLSISCSLGITLTSCASLQQPNTSEVPTATTSPNKTTSSQSKTTTSSSNQTSKNPSQSSESSAPKPSAAQPASGAKQPLTTEKLKNAEYFFLAKGPIQLKNGEYKEPSTQRTYTLSDVISYGDINRDGIKDAVTALKVTIPNTGTFAYLVALVNDAGSPKNISTEFMGREIKVETLKINSDNSIEAVLKQYQAGDPECCPSVEIKRTYKLRDNQIPSSNNTQPSKEGKSQP